jgi:transcriptional regulator with XRE-family HTH domain
MQAKKIFTSPESRALWTRIGAKIKAYRTMRQLTAADLAATVGLSRVSVSNAEAGNQRLYVDTLIKVARALEIPLMHLIPEMDSEELKPAEAESLKDASAERLGEVEKLMASLPPSAFKPPRRRRKE